MYINKKLMALLCLVLAASMMMAAGCAGRTQPGVTQAQGGVETIETTGQNQEVSMSEAPLYYEDVEELLTAVGLAKFSEFAQLEAQATQEVETRGFEDLCEIGELYEPATVLEGFELEGISVHASDSLALLHSDSEGNPANFIWSRTILPTNATTDFFGRGAIAENIVERGGVEYYISEWVTYEEREPDGWVVAWAQDGQAFMASLPAAFTEEDVLDFCDVQSVEAWQLDGDAVSVSIQGMDEVTVIDPLSLGAEIVEIDDVLYRDDGINEPEVVGYRWLIAPSVSRYQYVLEPGEYEFTADGVIDDPELLVMHFEGGDVVASVDFTEQLDESLATGFSLTVNADEVVELVIDDEPVELGSYTMEVAMGPDGIGDMYYEWYDEEYEADRYLITLYESANIVLTPTIFAEHPTLGPTDVSYEITQVLYYLDGDEYDTLLVGELGEFDITDIEGDYHLIAVKATMADSTVLTKKMLCFVATIPAR